MLALVAILAGCSPAEVGWARERRVLVFERLGEVIAATTPGARVLVVGNPFAQQKGAAAEVRNAEADALRGLKKGLGKAAAAVEVDYPALKPGALENPHQVEIPLGATTPLSFMTQPGAWDRLAEAHRESKVWVSLIGVPADIATTRAWTDPAGPRWVLYLADLTMIGSAEAVEEALKTGRLLAAVLARPGAPPEAEGLKSDRRAEFDARYLLLTQENLAGGRGVAPVPQRPSTPSP